jgi:hypothetical protein
MHLVNNADAVTQPNAIVVKLNVVTTRHRDRLFFVARLHRLSSATPACAERFATPPAILDLGRTRDNAPHTSEG